MSALAVEQERFVAYVAHELRTPLATQRALLELALTDPRADAAAWRDVAADVLDACAQQERLLDACLVLARGSCDLGRRAHVDLAAIAGDALRSHDLRGLDAVVALGPARVRGDAALVERLVANLVSNAIRHNRPGGRIEVATRAQGSHAVLVVANTGPRIPSDEVDRLFQPFHRFGGRARHASEGIGLGLPIVGAIAGAHGATITAVGRRGGGLEVGVRFPAAGA